MFVEEMMKKNFLILALLIITFSCIFANPRTIEEYLSSLPDTLDTVQIDDIIYDLRFFRTRGSIDGDPWTNGEVRYKFDSNLTQSARNDFVTATTWWSDVIPSLSFIEVTGIQTSPFINVRYDPSANNWYSSHVGMLPFMQNGQVLTLPNPPTALVMGSIVHEIGHSLGAIHEHQRSDRDSYVSVDQSLLGNVNYLLHSNSTNNTEYDFESIMHYSFSASLGFDPLPEYIQFLPNPPTGQRSHLSDKDIISMTFLYNEYDFEISSNLYQNQTGSVTFTFTALTEGDYYLQIWDDDMLTAPEWSWSPDYWTSNEFIGSNVYSLDADEECDITFNVLPDTDNENFYLKLMKQGWTGMYWWVFNSEFNLSTSEPLIADFTASPTSGYAPLSVQFSNQSTGNITSYLWNFGDGNTSTQENPNHTYQNSGSYTVSLTVSNGDVQDVKTRSNYIQVNTPSEPTLSNGYVTPNPGTSGDNFDFYVTYTDPAGNTPSNVKLKLTNQTYDMNHESGSVSTGALYKYSRSISNTGNLTYHFEANSGQQRFPETVGQFLTLTVNQSTVGWDIRITEIDVSPNSMQSGGPVDVDFRIHNNSNYPSYTYDNVPYDIRLYSPAGNLLDTDSGTTGFIGQGQYEWVDGEVSVPSNNGLYVITATIYPQLDENFNDNSMSTSVYVGDTGDVVKYMVPQNYECFWWEEGMSTQLPFNGQNYYLHAVTDNAVWVSTNNNMYDSEEIEEDDFELFTNNNTMIINNYSNHSSTYGGECWLSFGERYYSNTYNIANPYVSGMQGETVELHAHSNSEEFSTNDPEIYKGSVTDWFDDVQTQNSNHDYYVYFDIPSNQSTGNYYFWLDVEIDTPGSYSAHLVQKCRITVIASPPHISSISSSNISADDEITISGYQLGSSGSVYFGTIQCPANDIISWNSSNITCIVPEGIQNSTLHIANSTGTSNSIAYSVISSTGDPVLAQPVPDQTMTSGTTQVIADLTTTFWNPNSDDLTYDIIYTSTNISHSTTDNILSITAIDNISEVIPITVEASDPDVTVPDDFVLTVNDINDPPIISPIPDQNFPEDGSLSLDINYLSSYVNDPDNDTADLTFDIVDPDVFSVQLTGSSFNISAPDDWFGTGMITISVSDFEFTVNGNINIIVGPVNDPPILDIPDPITFLEDTMANIDFSPYCQQTWGENDNLTLSADSSTHIDVTVNVFLVTLEINTMNWNGTEQVTFHLDDNVSADSGRDIVSQTVDVVVEPVNDPPVIYLFEPDSTSVTMDEGTTLDFLINASDVDDDQLFYRWYIDEALISEANGSLYSYTPDYASAGYHILKCVVDDGATDLMSSNLHSNLSGSSNTDLTDFHQWNVTVINANQPPIANAGPDQNDIYEGDLVTLDGSASSDPDNDPITYLWTPPVGIALSDSTSVNPTFTAPQIPTNIPVDYTFNLEVFDHDSSAADTVVVTVININQSPVADAGADQTVLEFDLVQLDGSLSSDPDDDPLTYQWTAPVEIILSDPNIANPTFTAPELFTNDTVDYEFTLVVDDGITGREASVADTVVITVGNINESPIANAGDDQFVEIFELVTLDGSASYDPDSDPITYAWTSLNGITLSDPTAMNPIFTAPDVPIGIPTDYMFTLEVDDGIANNLRVTSIPDTVIITVVDNGELPIANAGLDQIVNEITEVALDGSESSCLSGFNLQYEWFSLNGISINNPNTVAPTFTAPELYTNDPDTLYFSLTVNDGNSDGSRSSSIPDTVMITVENINEQPVADAGDDTLYYENVQVQLDGSGSFDPDGDTLSYLWIAPDSISLTNVSIESPAFVAPSLSTNSLVLLDFVLQVFDNIDGSRIASEPDTVTITIKNINTPPIANAGNPQTVNEGVTVTLDGSMSYDPDLDSLEYHWYSPDSITLSDSLIVDPSFIAPDIPTNSPLIFEFILQVDDLGENFGRVMSEPDTVCITIENINQPPVADAGCDTTVYEGSFVQLDASGSYDPDGDPLQYQWYSTSQIVLSDTMTVNPTFIAPAVSDTTMFSIQLVVNDLYPMGVDNDFVNVTIAPITASHIPPIPIATQLIGNYPNPFNPETTIRFALDSEQFVIVDIYNIRGQKVQNLAQEELKEGYHEVVWNGKDSAGRDVATGLYFYRMQTKSFKEIRKMLMLK